jgi:hypothetical protein
MGFHGKIVYAHVAGVWESVFEVPPQIATIKSFKNIYHDTCCALIAILYSANRTVFLYLSASLLF